MPSESEAQKQWYNSAYKQKNYFVYNERVYGPYVRAIVRKAGIRKGARVLDVGCGQGFFSDLLRKSGLRVFGIDVSETAVTNAHETYGPAGTHFVVGDALAMPFSSGFDCIFCRSLSLYNRDDFKLSRWPTEVLLTYLRSGGYLIFLYNTNLKPSRQNQSWRYHTLADVRDHFAGLGSLSSFLVSKVDTLFFGGHAFHSLVTIGNVFLSRCFGLGGEIVCILRKES